MWPGYLHRKPVNPISILIFNKNSESQSSLMAGVIRSRLTGASHQCIHGRDRCREAISSLHPTPYTPHPTPYTPHPTPHTLHPTPYTLHPTPYTLHPTPYTLFDMQASCLF